MVTCQQVAVGKRENARCRWHSGEPGQLVHERASHGNVERSTDSQHGDLDDVIERGPYLGWQPSVLMTEKYHAVLGRLMNLCERNRILVQFHSDDLQAPPPLARSIQPIFDSTQWMQGLAGRVSPSLSACR